MSCWRRPNSPSKQTNSSLEELNSSTTSNNRSNSSSSNSNNCSSSSSSLMSSSNKKKLKWKKFPIISTKTLTVWDRRMKKRMIAFLTTSLLEEKRVTLPGEGNSRRQSHWRRTGFRPQQISREWKLEGETRILVFWTALTLVWEKLIKNELKFELGIFSVNFV